MNIVRRIGSLTLAALTAWWIVAPAMADDLPAPGDVRLFWQTELTPSPPGTTSRRYLSVDAISMPDGGILLQIATSNYRSIIVRLDGTGHEEWRISHAICPTDNPPCSNWSTGIIAPVATPEGGFLLVTDGAMIEEYDADGKLRRVLDPSDSPLYPSAILAVEHDVYYLAFRAMTEFDVPRDCCWPNGEIVRWSTERGTIWRLPLRLQYSQPEQSGFPVDLDLLSNGDLLWTLRGNDDRLSMTLMTPIDMWQVRVAPNGEIRSPGLLETSLHNSVGDVTVQENHVLPDGRLLRIISDRRLHESRWEFWDGSGSTRISVRAYPRSPGYLNTRGQYAFYATRYSDQGQARLCGFDADGNEIWSQQFSAFGTAFGDGTTSRIFMLRNRTIDVDNRRVVSLYLTTVQ